MKILFDERLRQLRKDAGLKQAQLAEAIGATQRKISYLESGQTEPDLYTLCMLADYFEVSTDYLLGRREY
ncbi:MAG: helix-turn-helix domain-containing protein [Candidatus Scatosoma sp.]